MMFKSDNSTLADLGDAAIVREIGVRIRSMRLSRNLTQEALAERAGLDRTTIVQLEKGRSATLLTLIQILRALGNLELLDGIKQETEVSPLKIAEILDKARKRASPKAKPAKRQKSKW